MCARGGVGGAREGAGACTQCVCVRSCTGRVWGWACVGLGCVELGACGWGGCMCGQGPVTVCVRVACDACDACVRSCVRTCVRVACVGRVCSSDGTGAADIYVRVSCAPVLRRKRVHRCGRVGAGARGGGGVRVCEGVCAGGRGQIIKRVTNVCCKNNNMPHQTRREAAGIRTKISPQIPLKSLLVWTTN